MNENVQKLVENTVKDILLGNTALTFLFAVPLAYIIRNGLDSVISARTARPGGNKGSQGQATSALNHVRQQQGNEYDQRPPFDDEAPF